MIHATEQSEAFLEMIRTLTNLEFEDTSYGNDCCDSIYNEKHKIQIFMPNVTNPFIEQMEYEDFVDFAVSFIDFDKDTNGTYIDKRFDIIELIQLLNSLEWAFDIDGHTETTLVDMMVEDANDERIDFEQFIKPYLQMDVEDQHMFGTDLGGQITVTRIK